MISVRTTGIVNSTLCTCSLDDVLSNGNSSQLSIIISKAGEETVVTETGVSIDDGATSTNSLTAYGFIIASAPYIVQVDSSTGAVTTTDGDNQSAIAPGIVAIVNKAGSETSTNQIKTVRRTLTAAEIKTLQSTPVKIITGVPGYSIQIISAAAFLSFGTVPFMSGTIYYYPFSSVAPGGEQAQQNAFLNNVADYSSTAVLLSAGGASNIISGDDLYITADADSVLGDSTARIEVIYRLVYDL